MFTISSETIHRCLRTCYVRRFLCFFLSTGFFVEIKMASHILKRILISSRSVPAILPIASRNFSRSAAALAPQVQHPAPTFKTQAVVNGAFKEISLEVICFGLTTTTNHMTCHVSVLATFILSFL